MIQDGLKLIVYTSQIGRRIASAVLLAHRPHKVLPQQDIRRRQLFDRRTPEIGLDLVAEDRDFSFSGACGDRRSDVALIDTKEF